MCLLVVSAPEVKGHGPQGGKYEFLNIFGLLTGNDPLMTFDPLICPYKYMGPQGLSLEVPYPGVETTKRHILGAICVLSMSSGAALALTLEL